MIKFSYIHKLPSGKWRVYSKSGKNMGTFDSKEEAEKRLGQIEYFKHKKRSEVYYAALQKISERTDTYSATVRNLNKDGDRQKVYQFLKSFKEAFDNAVDDTDDAEKAALMQLFRK